MNLPVRLTLGLAALVSTFAAACAPPAPGEAVADTEDGVSVGEPARITRANVAYDSSTGGIFENAEFDRGGQQVLVCRAFLDGTPEEKAACDDFPKNYEKITCNTVTAGFNDFRGTNGRLTECRGGGVAGRAPYDRDGEYRVTFVSEKDPSVRETAGLRLSSDFFSAFVLGKDIRPTGTAFDDALFGVPESSTTNVKGQLHLTLQMRRDLAPSLKGCVGAYSSAGMSTEEIEENDRQQLEACAQPSALLDGREGWKRRDDYPTNNRSQVSYDATSFLAPGLRLVFAFEVGGKVRSYIFQN